MENKFKHEVLGKLIGDLLLPLHGLSQLGWISTLSYIGHQPSRFWTGLGLLPQFPSHPR